MADGTIAERVSKLEARVEGLEGSSREMRAAIEDMRGEVRDARKSFADGLSDVKDQLRDVVIGSLNSMPPWAAKLLVAGGVLVGTMATVIGALLASGHHL